MPKNAAALSREIKGVWENADGRDLTLAERRRVEDLLSQAKSQQNIEGQIKDLNSGGGFHVALSGGGSSQYGRPGERFVESPGFKSIQDPDSRSQRWSTGAVDVGFLSKAGTLLESGQGAGLIPAPQVLPGAVTTLFETLGVADLFASGQATTSSVRYVNEGTATSGAAGVAEGGAKPPSDLTYSTIDEPVKKIATSLTVSDELLDDVSNVTQFVNGRLSLFVKIEEERQLLRGGGTNELVGLFGRGINIYPRGTVDNNAAAIARVIANTRGSSFLEPDAIVMHPSNWLATRLLTDTTGQYFGGGPFGNTYGNAQNPPGVFGQTLWGKPVVLSSVVGAGTALVGSFGQAAQIFRRGGVSVEATNSHASQFTQDLVTIRAESREALAVFRPQSFTEVRGLQ